jgi:creatinine amidohydrolase
MLHGYLPPHRFLPYLRWTEVARLPQRDRTVILLPIGAIEQHGPHLPLAVDSLLVTAVLGAALEQLDAAIPAYALPPLCYGKSNEHSGFPGTISLSAATLLSQITEIAASLHTSGFRKLALVNGHGGQPQVLEIAARDLRVRHPDLQVFPLFLWNVPHRIGELLTPEEAARGIHAGDAETSLLLHLLPDTVDMTQARPDGLAAQPPANALLSLEGALPYAWLTRDLSSSGTIGDPTTASAAKGAQIFDQLVTGWVRAIAALHHHEQPPVPAPSDPA